jgi:MFS family permease
MEYETTTTAADLARAVTIIALAIAAGGITRVVIDWLKRRRKVRMPWSMVIGVLLIMAGAAGAVIDNLHTDWSWLESPAFLAGAICIAWATWSMLDLRHASSPSAQPDQEVKP